MKKTLLVTIDYPPAIGGVATYWKQVVDSFSEDELTVLTLPANTIKETNQVVRKSLFFRYFWPKWLKGIFQIAKVYKQGNFEQIIVGEVLPVGAMIYLLNKVMTIPYYVQVHGMDLLQAGKQKRKKAFAQKILLGAKGVIANSHAVADIVKTYTNGKQEPTIIHPIPKYFPQRDSVKEQALLKQYQLENKTIILTVGRLVARKGQDKTLGAMMHVWQTHPNSVYVIVGDGPIRSQLQTMAEPNKNRVIFTGKVSNEERDAWFSLADVFIMPAREMQDDIEGFGIVYLEANSLGIPVIGGNAGGAKEAIEHETTGLLVNPEDIDDIAMGLLRLIEHPGYAKELGENGQKRLVTSFSWDSQVTRLRSLLTD